MKIYGYPDRNLPVEEIVPESLAEITLVASSAELRRIAEFLLEGLRQWSAWAPSTVTSISQTGMTRSSLPRTSSSLRLKPGPTNTLAGW